MLEASFGVRGGDPAAHAKIAEKTKLMLQVGKLLQEGGFGDSSDEEADEDASDAAGSRLRRKVAPAAISQPSDTPAAPPPPEPLASQARAFMAERAFMRSWRRGHSVRKLTRAPPPPKTAPVAR